MKVNALSKYIDSHIAIVTLLIRSCMFLVITLNKFVSGGASCLLISMPSAMHGDETIFEETLGKL